MQYIKIKNSFYKNLNLLFILFAVALMHAANVWCEEKVEGEEAGVPAGGKALGAAVKEGTAEGGNDSDREWAKRTTKLNIYETKMKELNKKIQQMIKAKNNNVQALDEKGKPVDVLETITTAFSDLKKTVKDYNAERDELKYKYPEEGARIERRYVPLRAQSIEQIEKEIGLNGELTRTKKKIDKKYAPFVGEDFIEPAPPKGTAPDSPANIEAEKAAGPTRIKLSR